MTDHDLFINLTDDPEVEYLLTKWDTGELDLATRPKGGRRWGPPIRLRPVPVEAVAR